MREITLKEITDAQDPLLLQVEKLFELLYEQMSGQGLILPLAEKGAELWIGTVKKMINRMGVLIVALNEERVVGFANGTIRFTPDYLGSLKIGSITHIFVLEELRKSGTGYKLVDVLEKWFKSKEVHSIELQVISNNLNGIDFWKGCNYQEELIQFRKVNLNG